MARSCVTLAVSSKRGRNPASRNRLEYPYPAPLTGPAIMMIGPAYQGNMNSFSLIP